MWGVRGGAWNHLVAILFCRLASISIITDCFCNLFGLCSDKAFILIVISFYAHVHVDCFIPIAFVTFASTNNLCFFELIGICLSQDLPI